MALGDLTRIQTNISAFNALSALKSVNRGLERAQLRLATGKRITEVADDPAGFVISKRSEKTFFEKNQSRSKFGTDLIGRVIVQSYQSLLTRSSFGRNDSFPRFC